MQYSQKTASFLKETKEQEASNVSEEQQWPQDMNWCSGQTG